ncbi:MAG: class I SAM-dependent methyltransferase [Burkholderiales bacterium]|nr:class I SAM-dependent methyltransferase [Burkholderiales bacterium]
MTYSRQNPSPRYRELTALYRTMHAEGERFMNLPSERTFPGVSLPPQAIRIKRLIDVTGATNILDYGSGKGMQYDVRDMQLSDGRVVPSIADYWNVDYVHCYDPSFPPFSKLPQGKFDAVISTDVLEHCPEEDVSWIVGELFGFAERFVFATVACYPARKRLPTGENAHCTIRPATWWAELASASAARHRGVAWEFWVQEREGTGDGARMVESRIGSEGAGR